MYVLNVNLINSLNPGHRTLALMALNICVIDSAYTDHVRLLHINVDDRYYSVV